MVESFRNQIVERVTPANIQSRYRETALRSIRKKFPDEVEHARLIFSEIDRQGAENFAFHNSVLFQGVRATLTHVSVKELAKQILEKNGEAISTISNSEEGTKPNDILRRVIAVFPAWALPPAGHPFDIWVKFMTKQSKRFQE